MVSWQDLCKPVRLVLLWCGAHFEIARVTLSALWACQIAVARLGYFQEQCYGGVSNMVRWCGGAVHGRCYSGTVAQFEQYGGTCSIRSTEVPTGDRTRVHIQKGKSFFFVV